MSKRTFDRLPDNIAYIFRVYERASNNLVPSKWPSMLRSIQQDSIENGNFQRYKVLNGQTPGERYNLRDYSPLQKKKLDFIFEEGINLGPIESIKTSDALNPVYLEDKDDSAPIIGYKSRRNRNYTPFQAEVLSSFASYFTPLIPYPQTSNFEGSLKWFQRLLIGTPLVLILEQKNKLLSDSSVNQLNTPLEELRKAVGLLKDHYNNTKEDFSKITRNYHLTDLSQLDVFALSLEKQDKLLTSIRASHITKEHNRSRVFQDGLANYLYSRKQIEIVDHKMQPVGVDINHLSEHYPLNDVFQQIEFNNVRDVFPYDLKYNEYKILTIENSIIGDDHTKLFEALEGFSEDFKIIAARLLLSCPLVGKFFDNIREENNDTRQSSYEDLLKIANLKEVVSDSEENNFKMLIKKLGSADLISVEHDLYHNAVYLLPSHKSEY